MILVGCQYYPPGNIVGEKPFSLEAAKKVVSEFPVILPEAPEDPKRIKECEAFREEMKQKNPLTEVLPEG
ncbi:hypothetical protein Efla_002634 [Eimeria flavescens]